MSPTMRQTFATWCRGTRAALDITQRELADAVGVSRSLIAAYETGRAAPDLDMVDRIGTALDVRFELVGRTPIVLGERRERDLLHARCSGYVHRRLAGLGFETAREVELVDGRTRGWIDLLAFDRRTGRLLIVEIKTGIDDLGAIERQIGWYERMFAEPARAHGWSPTGVHVWLLALATEDVDAAIVRQREVIDLAFPVRATEMQRLLSGSGAATGGRGLALIDPRRRRASWLLPTRLDGRRTGAPYRDRADARHRLAIGRGASTRVTMSARLPRS